MIGPPLQIKPRKQPMELEPWINEHAHETVGVEGQKNPQDWSATSSIRLKVTTVTAIITHTEMLGPYI